MPEEDLFAFYRGTFQKIYADLVAVTNTKPEQVLIEIENAFTHVSSAKANPESAGKNIEKAKGHLLRAALDCSKMLWVEQSRQVRVFTDSEALQTFCTNDPNGEFAKLFSKANEMAKEARRHEMLNVGIAPEESIGQYYDAAVAMSEVLSMCDYEKLKKFQKFTLGVWIKNHSVALVIGVIGGIISTWVMTL